LVFWYTSSQAHTIGVTPGQESPHEGDQMLFVLRNRLPAIVVVLLALPFLFTTHPALAHSTNGGQFMVAPQATCTSTTITTISDSHMHLTADGDFGVEAAVQEKVDTISDINCGIRVTAWYLNQSNVTGHNITMPLNCAPGTACSYYKLIQNSNTDLETAYPNTTLAPGAEAQFAGQWITKKGCNIWAFAEWGNLLGGNGWNASSPQVCAF
jgi:hypothetical protein